MFKQVNSLLLIKSYFVFNFLLLLFWLKKILNFWQFAKINTREKSSNEPSAKINTRKMQFFFEKKLPRKLVPVEIGTVKVFHNIWQQIK